MHIHYKQIRILQNAIMQLLILVQKLYRATSRNKVTHYDAFFVCFCFVFCIQTDFMFAMFQRKATRRRGIQMISFFYIYRKSLHIHLHCEFREKFGVCIRQILIEK